MSFDTLYEFLKSRDGLKLEKDGFRNIYNFFQQQLHDNCTEITLLHIFRLLVQFLIHCNDHELFEKLSNLFSDILLYSLHRNENNPILNEFHLLGELLAYLFQMLSGIQEMDEFLLYLKIQFPIASSYDIQPVKLEIKINQFQYLLRLCRLWADCYQRLSQVHEIASTASIAITIIRNGLLFITRSFYLTKEPVLLLDVISDMFVSSLSFAKLIYTEYNIMEICESSLQWLQCCLNVNSHSSVDYLILLDCFQMISAALHSFPNKEHPLLKEFIEAIDFNSITNSLIVLRGSMEYHHRPEKLDDTLWLWYTIGSSLPRGRQVSLTQLMECCDSSPFLSKCLSL